MNEFEGVGASAAASVDEVAEDNELFGAGGVDECRECLQDAMSLVRNGDGCGAKGGFFSEVNICDEERGLIGPPNGVLGQEENLLSCEWNRESAGKMFSGCIHLVD